MNIIEAYIKKYNQLIILISGLSGSGKTILARNISRDFKISFFDEADYCNTEYNKKIKIGDQEFINWDSDDIYLWEKINETVRENAKKGLVMCGTAFPLDKIKFNVDIHINIKINKNNLFMIREKFIQEKHCANIPEDENIRLKIFKNYTFTYNEDVLKRSKINKQINANNYVDDLEKYNDNIYDIAFNYLIEKIEKEVYK